MNNAPLKIAGDDASANSRASVAARIVTSIYAVYDTVTQDLAGGLFLYKHPAAAIRSFRDGLTDKQSALSRHPADFELHCLGHLDENSNIHGDHSVIITGATLMNAIREDEPNA